MTRVIIEVEEDLLLVLQFIVVYRGFLVFNIDHLMVASLIMTDARIN